MAKVKRSVLKQLIKECLVEILIEGIDSEPGINALAEAARPRPTSRRNPEMERIQKSRDVLDSKKVNPKTVNENVINSVTSDPVMADILRDTASTTLKSQGLANTAHGHPGQQSADPVVQAVASAELDQLFEGSQNWAHLAFEKGPKK
jgi:hypothetical protein